VAQLHVPRSLAALFPDVPRQLELDADDVAGLVRLLDERYPGMADRLCEPGPRLRPHIKVFVDRQLAALDTPLTGVSEVHIIPAVSGGSGPRSLG
jgi:molybdopterin converting factor small subunit